MAQSIKLNNDNYIDATGVWDSTLNKTQKSINNDVSTSALSISNTYISSTDTNYMHKFGKMVVGRFMGKLVSGLSLNTEYPIANIPTAYIPKAVILVASYDTGSNKTTQSHDVEFRTDGGVYLLLRNTYDSTRWFCFNYVYLTN